ncbi:MAG: hypothetical protein ACM3X6_02195 [Patescibacteria group bacterium]
MQDEIHQEVKGLRRLQHLGALTAHVGGYGSAADDALYSKV